jgi:hypothetical protein
VSRRPSSPSESRDGCHCHAPWLQAGARARWSPRPRGRVDQPFAGPLQRCSNLLVCPISRFALKLVSSRLVCVRWCSGWSTIMRRRLSTSFCLGPEKLRRACRTLTDARQKCLLAAKGEPGSDQQQQPWPQVVFHRFLASSFALRASRA